MAAEPTLFDALLAVHREVATFPKDGWNDQSQYSFAKGDTVVRKSRELLAKHGILWIRTGASVTGPTLDKGDIGRMTYVGNVKITGKLMHAAGELPISAEPPIVVMGSRPHDKAWAASVTFGTGYLLLGVLNQDRANEEEINNRQEPEPGEPKAVSKDVLCRTIDTKIDSYCAAFDLTKRDAWAEGLRMAGLPPDSGGDDGPWGDIPEAGLRAIISAYGRAMAT